MATRTVATGPDLNALMRLVNSARFVELEIRAQSLLERFPDSGPLWSMLGVALWKQGKDALTALENAARLMPSDAEAQSNVGNLLRTRGRLDEAAARHRRAIDIAANYADAHNNLGSVLRDLGRLEEAVVSYRRALVIRPDFAMAHHNLGLTLQDLGLLADAIACYRRALRGRPSDAIIHQCMGNALLQLRQLDGAAASFGKAIAINPRSADAHNNLGNVLRELGAVEAAAESYRRALELEPVAAEAHCNLGNVLVDLGAWEQAVDSYRRALEIKPHYVKAYNHLGNVLRLLNRAHEAEESYRRGLEIDPESSETISSLADLRADRGLFDEAETLYRHAIGVKGILPRAWAGIAGLRKMTSADADWLTQAECIAAQPLLPREEVHLRYAMGKYFDDIRDFDRAFEHYLRANELTKTYRPPHARVQLTGKFDLLAQFYDRDWLEQARAGADDSRRPVLIVGMPRSGTSLAEQILSSHAAVFGAGELPFWNLSSLTVAAATVKGVPAHSAVASVAQEYLRLLREKSADALRVIDKMPANFAYLGLVHAAFPNARIIHMSRHPADTCLSIFFQNFHLVYSYANDLDDVAHYYAEYLRIMEHWRSLLPAGSILDVPYEALIEDPETWSRSMVEFIGLPWDSACLDFHRTSRNVSTFSRWQVRQKISNSSVDRWRNYERYIGPLLPLLNPSRLP